VNVRLGAAVVCTADGNTDDPAFNAPLYATTAVNASSTGVVTQTAPGNLTLTGCAAGNIEHLQVIRNRYDSNDTYPGYVYLNGLGLQLGCNEDTTHNLRFLLGSLHAAGFRAEQHGIEASHYGL
jgi:hypothetical protein